MGAAKPPSPRIRIQFGLSRSPNYARIVATCERIPTYKRESAGQAVTHSVETNDAEVAIAVWRVIGRWASARLWIDQTEAEQAELEELLASSQAESLVRRLREPALITAIGLMGVCLAALVAVTAMNRESGLLRELLMVVVALGVFVSLLTGLLEELVFSKSGRRRRLAFYVGTALFLANGIMIAAVLLALRPEKHEQDHEMVFFLGDDSTFVGLKDLADLNYAAEVASLNAESAETNFRGYTMDDYFVDLAEAIFTQSLFGYFRDCWDGRPVDVDVRPLLTMAGASDCEQSGLGRSALGIGALLNSRTTANPFLAKASPAGGYLPPDQLIESYHVKSWLSANHDARVVRLSNRFVTQTVVFSKLHDFETRLPVSLVEPRPKRIRAFVVRVTLYEDWNRWRSGHPKRRYYQRFAGRIRRALEELDWSNRVLAYTYENPFLQQDLRRALALSDRPNHFEGRNHGIKGEPYSPVLKQMSKGNLQAIDGDGRTPSIAPPRRRR